MIREALTVHVELLIEDGVPPPAHAMSIDEAIAHHSEALSESLEGSLAKFRDAVPTISTTFRLVEIEVPALQLGSV